MGIEDPVGLQEGWPHVAAMYLKYVMLGINCRNTTSTRAKTVKGYAEAINTLFELRHCPLPVQFKDKENSATVIIHNLEVEENVARQRKPLDNKIQGEMAKQAAAAGEDSAEMAVFNIVCAGRILGLRAGEYAQKTQTKVEVHKYPGGREEIKAFLARDLAFFDKNGTRITKRSTGELNKLAHVDVTFRIQKNRQNGQRIRVRADQQHKAICPVRSLFLMILRKIRLKHSLETPLAVFVNKKNETKYLTAAKVAEVIRKAVKAAYPDITDDELKKYSAHSVRVWAAVLLYEMGKSSDFLKSRLRWLGDSYRMYLRDTDAINQQHLEALEANTEATMALIGNNLCDSLVPNVVSDDEEMGDYEDIID